MSRSVSITLRLIDRKYLKELLFNINNTLAILLKIYNKPFNFLGY